MTFTAGTSVIPSDEISVSYATTTLAPTDFERSVGYIGSADLSTDQGTAEPNTVYQVQNSSQATNLFGEDSELTRQITLAFANGVGEVYATAVAKQSASETVSADNSGTLTESPVFDPNVNPSATIEETQASEEVHIVYDETPSAPDSGINLNPISRNFTAANSGDYTIEYQYGDFSDAIVAMTDESPRVISTLTEVESVYTQTDTELSEDQQNFDFAHNISGLSPVGSEESTTAYVSNTDPLGTESNRTALVASSRAYTDTAKTEEVRFSGVAAAMAAAKPLGTSITADEPDGIVSLRDNFSINEMSDLLDNGVMAVGVYGGINVIQDRMTTQEAGFTRLYSNEVVDEAVTRLHVESKRYIGEQSTETNINNYKRRLRNQMLDLRDDSPPKLDAFNISITQNADGDLDATIILDVVDIIDNISIDAIVGDILNAEVSA